MIGRSGEIGSGISVPVARDDDVDDDFSCPLYGTQLDPMVRLQLWISRKCRVTAHVSIAPRLIFTWNKSPC